MIGLWFRDLTASVADIWEEREMRGGLGAREEVVAKSMWQWAVSVT